MTPDTLAKAKGIPRLKWPRSLDGKAQVVELEKIFAQNCRPLWKEGTFRVAHPKIAQAFKEVMPQLLGRKQVDRGFENISGLLACEKKGLEALQKKQNNSPAYRVSRLLVIGNSGSERFNRHCEKLLIEHSDRVLGLCLDQESSELMEKLYGEDSLAKVLLISHKDAVAQALLALVSSPSPRGPVKP